MGWAGPAQSHLLALGAGVQQAGSTVLVLQKLSSLLSKSCFCLLLGGLGTPTLCSKLSSIRWGLRARKGTQGPDPEHATPRAHLCVCVRVCRWQEAHSLLILGGPDGSAECSTRDQLRPPPLLVA